MRIDAHNHFWKYDRQSHSWISEEMSVIRRDFYPRDLLPHLIKNKIDGTIAVQADQSEDETLFLLELANQHEYVKGVVGWVDLKSHDLRQRLERFSGYRKLKGFRHIVQSEPAGFLLDQDFIRGVRTLSEFGFTYDLLIYHYQLNDALRFVAQVPDVKIVVDHIAKPSIRTREKTEWELKIASLATFENVNCKLSGMVSEAVWSSWKYEDFVPYLDEVIEAFGSERLMYGSDWPVCLVAASYEQQLSIVLQYISRLSNGEQQNIMGRNASEFYKL